MLCRYFLLGNLKSLLISLGRLIWICSVIYLQSFFFCTFWMGMWQRSYFFMYSAVDRPPHTLIWMNTHNSSHSLFYRLPLIFWVTYFFFCLMTKLIKDRGTVLLQDTPNWYRIKNKMAILSRCTVGNFVGEVTKTQNFEGFALGRLTSVCAAAYIWTIGYLQGCSWLLASVHWAWGFSIQAALADDSYKAGLAQGKAWSAWAPGGKKK